MVEQVRDSLCSPVSFTSQNDLALKIKPSACPSSISPVKVLKDALFPMHFTNCSTSTGRVTDYWFIVIFVKLIWS